MVHFQTWIEILEVEVIFANGLACVYKGACDDAVVDKHHLGEKTFSTVVPNQIFCVRKCSKPFSCRLALSHSFQGYFILLCFPPDIFRVLF